MLAHKKRGFGKDLWNGMGGKLEKGESMKESAIRELEEEVGVKAKVKDLRKVATHIFHLPENPPYPEEDQEVQVFLINWILEMGEPHESEEMNPKWFKKSEVPYDQMWEDDKIWLPRVLNGEKLSCDWTFSKGEDGKYKLEGYKVTPI